MKSVVKVFVILGMLGFASEVHAEDAASAWEVTPALVGTTVPDISFVDAEGTAFSLRDRAKEKPLILVVYRGLW